MNTALALPAASTALLIIDMQRDFCAAGGYAARAWLNVARLAAPISAITRLLAAARGAGLLVRHTLEGHVADLSDCPPEKLPRSTAAGAPIGSAGPLGRLLVRGEDGHDSIDELQPLPGEPMIDMPGYSAFHQTGLRCCASPGWRRATVNQPRRPRWLPWARKAWPGSDPAPAHRFRQGE